MLSNVYKRITDQYDKKKKKYDQLMYLNWKSNVMQTNQYLYTAYVCMYVNMD